MHHYSTIQALEVWSELWKAYYGRNNYGGSEAEIYTYTIQPHRPGGAYDAHRTTEDMIELLTLFTTEADCEITVDGVTLRDIPKSTNFLHRWHIKVTPK